MQKIVKINKSVEREFIRSLLLTSLFVFVSLEPAAAQWRQVLTVNEAVNRTYFVPNSHLAIAASGVGPDYDSSSLWRSTDDGETWTRATPNYFDAGSVTDIAFADSLIGWASFKYGNSQNLVPNGAAWVPYLWKTTDGGKTWFPLNGPDNVNVYGTEGLFYNSFSGLLVVAIGGQMLLSTDEGLSWLSPEQFPWDGPTGYFFLDSLHGAAGWGNNGFSITSDGGFTWSALSPFLFPCGVQPSGYFKNGMRYFMVASQFSYNIISTNNANSVVLTSDDGMTWDSLSTIPWGPGPIIFNIIVGDIRKDCNLFYLNAADSGIYRSNDSGRDWFCIGGPISVEGTNSSLFDVKDGRILVGSANGGIWLYAPPAYALQFSEDTVRAQIGAITEIPIQITNANGTVLFDSSSFEFDYDTNAFIFEGIESSAGYLVRFQKNLNGSVMITLIRDTLNTAPQDTATVTVDFQPILTVPQKDSSYVMVHSALFNDLSVCAPVTQSIASALVNIELGCGDSTILAFMQGQPLFSIVSIQPNPASSELTVTLSGSVQPEIEMYDALGRDQDVRCGACPELVEGSLQKSVGLDVSSLPVGIYYLRFSAGGYVQTRIVSIER